MIDFNTICMAIIGTSNARVEVSPCRGHYVASRVSFEANEECQFGHGGSPSGALLDLLANVLGARREAETDANIEGALVASLDDARARKASGQ